MATAFNMLRPNDLIWSLHRRQLSQGQIADALRPARSGIPIRRACPPRTTPSICAIAISRTISRKGAWLIDGVTIDLEKVTIPDLQSRRQGRSYRARALGLHGSRHFGGRGALCAGGLRPYRRRDQSGRASRNISIGPAGPSASSSRDGSSGQGAQGHHGGPIGLPGSSGRRRNAWPRACPAAASSRRSRMRRGFM